MLHYATLISQIEMLRNMGFSDDLLYALKIGEFCVLAVYESET
jgi:hypothetical protein